MGGLLAVEPLQADAWEAVPKGKHPPLDIHSLKLCMGRYWSEVTGLSGG
jgi:hypothetical protein